MRILLTGVTGYIGKRLLPVLLEEGHQVICCTRNADRLELDPNWNVEIFEHDFLYPVDIQKAPLHFDVAYFLIHSMSASISNFEQMEETAAGNFRDFIDQTTAQQIIYLTGMVNDEHLSRHLQSRFRVEEVLGSGRAPLTALRAGIIVGSGSASFEIIRDLVEKLPVMIAPRWLDTRCEPIAIRDVIKFLTGVLLREDCLGRDFDIGNGEVLTYKDMLMGYAEVRDLRRWVIPVPVMTPRLSSYWLYFVTSTTYELAVNLVDSMKVDVIARDHTLTDLLELEPITYHQAVEFAFDKIEQHMVVSSWKDSLVHSSRLGSLKQYVNVPSYGCFKDEQCIPFDGAERDRVWQNILAIGGDRGWYYANALWKFRGFLDKLVGGVGLRRGRTNPQTVFPGDSLDFWRVLVADNENRRLLLYAEMKLPGEAWLEFRLRPRDGAWELQQKATFRPYGIAGRLYWLIVSPFHFFVFRGMARRLVQYDSRTTLPTVKPSSSAGS